MDYLDQSIELYAGLVLSDLASRVILDFRRTGGWTYEGDGINITTSVDSAVHNLVFPILEKEFPECIIISEESNYQRCELSELLIQDKVWVMDPLDGSKQFKDGSSEFAFIVGYMENFVPLVGVCSFPAKKKIYFARKGGDAYQNVLGKNPYINPKQCKVSGISDLDKIILVASRLKDKIFEDWAISLGVSPKDKIRLKRYDGASKAFEVINGRAEAYLGLSPFRLWDVLGFIPIVEAAGGKVTTAFGGDVIESALPDGVLGEGILVTNGIVHNRILEVNYNMKQEIEAYLGKRAAEDFRSEYRESAW